MRDIRDMEAFAKSQNVIEDIYAERRRQVDNLGWSLEHDDEHDGGEIARAAAAYAAPPGFQGTSWLDLYTRDMWPWHPDGFRRKDRRRDLIRAAALIVAEIERLDRALSKVPSEGSYIRDKAD